MSGSSYYFWAPLGESEAAAGVMAAMFFAGAVVCLVHLKTTNFKLYMEGGALAAICKFARSRCAHQPGPSLPSADAMNTSQRMVLPTVVQSAACRWRSRRAPSARATPTPP